MLVTVLGTGIMGAPIARNVSAAGLQTRAWNRSIQRAQPLAQDGVEVIADAREAVRGADVVVTMLSDGEAVRAVLEDEGVLDAMGHSAVLCQMSTVGIAAIERIGALCERRDVALVDAPVSGTREPAEQGKLVVLASGPDDAVERCSAVFDAVGSTTVTLGEAGEATRLKLVLNHWLLALVDGLAETIGLAEALDVDPRTFLETISGGPLGPAYADVKGSAMLEREFSPPSFPLSLAAKDARLVEEAAARHGHALGILPVIRERMERAAADGHGDEDMAAVFLAG